MPFMPNPLRPGPLNMAQDIMNYTTNPHIESAYNPITARSPMGHPIRDQVFERGTLGQPLESRVTGRSAMGHPITTPVIDLTRSVTYRADNFIGSSSIFDDVISRLRDSLMVEERASRYYAGLMAKGR